ncbi:flavin reductase family protein [Alteromonadaceae bacterium M269]|nr:flavin reductase family protein [Alteromonadaceae bacterium M269]
MSENHFYEPKNGHGLKHDPFNAIIAPRPIGWISSQDDSGVLNLAPYSFFNALNYTPPIIGFSSQGYKDSIRNIEATGEFCWNLVTQSLVGAMNQTSASLEADVDEFAFADLETVASTLVKPPRVKMSPVSMECRLSQIVQLKSASGELCDSWLVMGEVVGVHINQSVIEDGVYSTVSAEPIMRGGGAGDYYTINEQNKFQLIRPSVK